MSIMQLEMMNPTTPVLAGGVIGSGSWVSSQATPPEYHTAAAVVQKLQRAYRVDELHAATIARLASLGPQEGR